MILYTARSNAETIKVLYLGNSHTFWHDLPQLTANLASSNGDMIIFSSNTPGGCTLGHPSNGHLFNSISLSLINSENWDYVVLQEHSLFAVIDHYKYTYMYPAAQALDSLIKLNYPCTKTIMQLIWGKKQGGEHCINTYCSVDFDDFSHMQDSLTTEYMRLTDTINGILAPTGRAWQESIENSDPIELFDPDESHPSLAGHYLAACVYYATMFQKPSVGISYTGGLTSDEANYLQQIADEVVFFEPGIWDLTSDVTFAGFDIEQDENTVFCYDTSTGATSYFWDFGDDYTDTIQNPVHTYTSSGTYTITQTAISDCDIDTAMATLDIVITDNHNKHSEEEDISFIIMPNYENVKIVCGFNNISAIRVYNIVGALVSSKRVDNSNEFIVPINNMEKGIYIISVEHGRKVTNKKIIR